MKLSIARLYTKNCNIEFNYNSIVNLYRKAIDEGSDFILFPRLSLTGLNIKDTFLKKDFIDSYMKSFENLLDITIGEKTKILIGSLYQDGGNFYDSLIFIDNGYIDTVVSRKEIDKRNIFNDYRYFDKSSILNQILYNKKKFSVLISDDIYSNFNVFLVSDNKPNYILCFDTSVRNIDDRKKHLIKLAKFANSPVFYINNATIYNNYYFRGELILIDEDFDLKYYDIYKQDSLFSFEIDCEDGTELLIRNSTLKNYDISYLLKKEDFLIDGESILYEDLKYIKDFNFMDDSILFNYINKNIYDKLSNECKREIRSVISNK